jgi:hypothetical protein
MNAAILTRSVTVNATGDVAFAADVLRAPSPESPATCGRSAGRSRWR